MIKIVKNFFTDGIDISLFNILAITAFIWWGFLPIDRVFYPIAWLIPAIPLCLFAGYCLRVTATDGYRAGDVSGAVAPCFLACFYGIGAISSIIEYWI